MNDLRQIFEIVYSSFFHIWPYLVLTIPLSVAIHISGISKRINLTLKRKPFISILIATFVGAFSPFCSCGIIPIIASMLIGGVPLAPIMSFWVASPSMDPEIFFLSVGMLGWNLAFWRLGSTLVLSLAAGFVTHYLVKSDWFGEYILATSSKPKIRKTKDLVVDAWVSFRRWLRGSFLSNTNSVQFASAIADSSKTANFTGPGASCTSCEEQVPEPEPVESSCGCGEDEETSCCTQTKPIEKTLSQKILGETWGATFLVVKFMGLAFLVKALITLYVPDEIILSILGENNIFSVLIATIIGVPFYTSNLAALPVIGGFLEQGLDSGAALAFLIAGPITTLPAMAAVWGIANRRVFIVYLLIPLVGAVFFGYLFNFLKLF